MKNRFSSLDILCMVKELQCLVGMRVNQIYDIDNKTYLIKLQIPEKKAVLLLESGIRFNKTSFDWPKNDHPSGFCMKLRKHIRNKRLEHLKQVGKDRIVDLQFGTAEAAYHIFIELFDKGNIILTDNSLIIVNVLRFHSEGENKCMVREVYSLESKKRFDKSDKNINDVLINAKVGDPFKKLLSPFVDYGPACVDHILFAMGYEKGAKINCAFTQSAVDKFVEEFTSILNIVETACNKPSKGYIIKKKEIRSNGDEFLTNVEFHPYWFQQFSSNPFDEFDDFNIAVDEFYSQLESQKIDMKALHDEKNALKKVEKIRQDQATRLKVLDQKQQVDTLKAELITYNIDKVDEAITTIRSALAAQMSWSEISELVEMAKNDPIGSLITKLKFETNCITLQLYNPFSESDENNGILVDVDLDLSAYGNVKKYYSNKKSASTKQQKTILAQSIALKSAEKKVENVLKDIQMNASITKSRMVFWFEKFFWFISSENYLVIGSRDKIQAELIIRRYMQTGDIFIHTDIPGSSCFIIKNPNTSVISPKTLNEAGTMAVCFSSAWNVHVITNAWWVKSDQVIKVNPLLGNDPFYTISGTKNYLPPGQLAIGFGFIFYIDELSAERHLGERQVKFVEETNPDIPDMIQDDADEIELDSIGEINSQMDESRKEHQSDSYEDNNVNNECTIDQDISRESESSSDDTTEIQISESTSNPEPNVEMQSNLETLNKEGNESVLNNNAEETTKDKSQNKGKKGIKKQIDHTQRNIDEKKQKEVIDDRLKRGQKSKLKKIKEKYKDQDEEEKQLRMAILQSAGSKKENSKKNLKHAKEQAALEKKVKRTYNRPPIITQIDLQENKREDMEDVDNPINTDLSLLNRLTGIPHHEDKIIFALPVVAPYNTVVSYKYRVKMIPGTSKRGKSARSALNIFLNSKETNEQEKAMMKNVNDQILCRDLPGKVKLSVGQATAKLRKKR